MPKDPYHDDKLDGDYARDTHRGGLGDDYARETPQPVPDEDQDEDEDEIGVGKSSE